eukprot:352471_1
MFWSLHALLILSLHLYAYEPIVNDLQRYVKSNHTFALQLNKTFQEANASYVIYKDMYEFFDVWLKKAPPPDPWSFPEENMLSWNLIKFGRNTTTGSTIFSSRVAQMWFGRYMMKAKEFCDSPASTGIIPVWEALPNMNMSQYIIPPNGFQSFNDFFVRHIKKKYRPIDSPNDDTIITSPCDGQIIQIDTNLKLNKNYTIKEANYSLSTMLKNDYYSKQFVGGTIIQIYLQQNNYHRYHCSVSGYVDQIDQIGGFQFWEPFPGNVLTGQQWLANNCRRGILYIDTGKFGIVAHNYVGVWLVNSVNIHTIPGTYINKGDETGYFKYGGSTIALLFQKDAIKTIVGHINQYVNVGQRIAIANSQFYSVNKGTYKAKDNCADEEIESSTNVSTHLNRSHFGVLELCAFLLFIGGLIILLYLLGKYCYGFCATKGYQSI